MAFTGSFDRSPPLGTVKNEVALARIKSYFTGSFRHDIVTSTTTIEGQSRPIYRGILAGSYVYSIGSPPGGGATFITIIGYTE